MADELTEFETQLKAFLENVEETLTQTGAMGETLLLGVQADLRLATLLERQIILGELQQIREHVVSALSSIATFRNAVAQERATKEYELARRSSEALTRSNTGLQKAIDRARDAMERGATLEPIARLVDLISQAIIEQGALTVLLARTSRDDIIRQQAGQLEEGLRQIERESKQQQLKILYSNRAKLQEQAARFGTIESAPLGIQNELAEIETEIGTIKKDLGR